MDISDCLRKLMSFIDDIRSCFLVSRLWLRVTSEHPTIPYWKNLMVERKDSQLIYVEINYQIHARNYIFKLTNEDILHNRVPCDKISAHVNQYHKASPLFLHDFSLVDHILALHKSDTINYIIAAKYAIYTGRGDILKYLFNSKRVFPSVMLLIDILDYSLYEYMGYFATVTISYDDMQYYIFKYIMKFAKTSQYVEYHDDILYSLIRIITKCNDSTAQHLAAFIKQENEVSIIWEKLLETCIYINL